MVFRINNKKEFIFTYATDYLGALTARGIYNLFTVTLGVDFDVIVSKEHGDKAHNHNHFHVYARYKGPNKNGFSTRNQKLFYVPLDFNIIKIYDFEEPDINMPFVYEKEETMLNLGKSWSGTAWSKINNAVVAHYGFAKWKIIDKSVYDVKYKGIKYGPECKSTISMIEYVTKNPIEEVLSNFDWKKKLDELKKSESDKKKNKEPDWVLMKQNGMTANEALEYIKNNFTREYFRYWYKWEAPFYKFFCENREDFEIDLEAEYWIPLEVKTYFDNVYKPYFDHRNDPNWLRKHRLDRPGSLVWIGDSQRAKTTVVRSLFLCNYYHTLIDGMTDFDENCPCVVLDDFHINLKKYLPSWKCWLGCQTNFTVNPKYGKRRKINWGHPCIFLNNEDFRECKESPEKLNTIWTETELNYIKTNCTFVNTGDQKLWEEPTGMDRFKYVKIKIKDFRPDLCKEEEEEEDLNDYASDVDRECENGNSFIIIDSDDENDNNHNFVLPRLIRNKRSFETELGQLSPIPKRRRNSW